MDAPWPWPLAWPWLALGLALGWPLAWPWLALGLALAGPWPGPWLALGPGSNREIKLQYFIKKIGNHIIVEGGGLRPAGGFRQSMGLSQTYRAPIK